MNFLNGSFRFGRLFGIDIRVHVLFLIFVAWRLVTAGDYWRTEGLFLALLFGIVLLHEFGHCFGARSVGGDAQDILMWPLGGLAYAHAPMRPWPQFVTVAAGPLVNLLFCLASGAAFYLVTGTYELLLINPLEGIALPGTLNLISSIWIFYQVNLLLLAFNLLPIYPLDGGQIFQALVWPFVGLQRATEIACYLGLAGCAALGLWGLRGGGSMLLFIALFGGMVCWQRLQAARFGMIYEDTRFTPRRYGRAGGWRAFWRRLAGRERPTAARPVRTTPSPNPNPGAWEARLSEQERLEAEVNRILKKVSEQGVHSLTYTERQTLERATRERQRQERQFQRDTRL